MLSSARTLTWFHHVWPSKCCRAGGAAKRLVARAKVTAQNDRIGRIGVLPFKVGSARGAYQILRIPQALSRAPVRERRAAAVSPPKAGVAAPTTGSGKGAGSLQLGLRSSQTFVALSRSSLS